MNCQKRLAIIAFSIEISLAAIIIGAASAPVPVLGVSRKVAAKETIDESALAILKKVETAMFNLKSYRAECWTKVKRDPKSDGTPGKISYEMGTLTAVKPNLMRFDSWEMIAQEANAPPSTWKRKDETPQFTFVCDGKTNWRQYGDSYSTDTQTKQQNLSTNLEPWGGFYSKESSPYAFLSYIQKENGLLAVRHDGTETIDGVLCDRVFTHMKVSYQDKWQEYKTTWFVGIKDCLVRRKVERIDFENREGYIRDATVRNIVVNTPLANPKGLFTYEPPKGVNPQKAPQVAQQDVPKIKRPPLLKNGLVAPDFIARDKDGRTIKLSDYRGKVVILDFWASWCAPCVDAMPHNQAVIKRLQSENLPVVLLALNNSEPQKPFLKWIGDHKELNAITFLFSDPGTAPLGTIATDLYKVTAIPSLYIIDAKGIIRDSDIGFRGATDSLEKSVRNALMPNKVK